MGTTFGRAAMHITISNYEDVPRIQQQRKLTKILTLIEPFCHVPYHDFGPDLLAQTYIHRIGVSDHRHLNRPHSPSAITSAPAVRCARNPSFAERPRKGQRPRPFTNCDVHERGLLQPLN